MSATEYPDLYYFPIVVSPLVVVYSQPVHASLRLDADVVGKIFIGDINNWNDTEIQSINPDMVLPNMTISVVLRDGSAGTTSSFATILSEISPSFQNRLKLLGIPSNFNDWGMVAPQLKAFNPNFQYTLFRGETEVIFGVVLSQEGAVSFGPLSFALNFAMNYAWMKNGYGNVINAEQEQILQLPPNITMPDEKSFYVFEKPIINRNFPDAWPMVAMTYINVNVTANDRCNLRRDAAKFFVWVLTSKSASYLAALNGFVNIPPQLESYILPHLHTIECSGESLLSYRIVPKHNTASIGGLVVSFVICVFVVVVHILLLPTYKHRLVSKVLTSILCFSSVINYLSLIFWFLEADRNAICLARVWVFAIANTLLMSVVFNTTLQYYFIKITIDDHAQMNTKFSFLPSTLGIIGSFLLIQIVLLVVWTVVDPYISVVQVTNQVDYVGSYACDSTYLSTWLIIECIFFLILLIFGLYCVVYTWKILTTKSRWLLMCIYNSVIVFAICIVYFTLKVPNDSEIYNIITIFVLVITVGFDAAVFVPKLAESNYSLSSFKSH
uniref:G-protein coupled receptors family 3 profile domain-containing protein n=1 Tax=Arcella intermedia TaxID=1963864 RepID=A0A6B2L020_9EUKA